MSVKTIEKRILCDGCGYSVDVYLDAGQTVAAVRKSLVAEDWSIKKGKDLCFSCNPESEWYEPAALPEDES